MYYSMLEKEKSFRNYILVQDCCRIIRKAVHSFIPKFDHTLFGFAAQCANAQRDYNALCRLFYLAETEHYKKYVARFFGSRKHPMKAFLPEKIKSMQRYANLYNDPVTVGQLLMQLPYVEEDTRSNLMW